MAEGAQEYKTMPWHLTDKLPEWVDGVLPSTGTRVIVIHEIELATTCSAVIPRRFSVSKMLNDYGYTRAFERTGEVITVEVHVYQDGQEITPEPPKHIITKAESGRTHVKPISLSQPAPPYKERIFARRTCGNKECQRQICSGLHCQERIVTLA